MSDTVHAIIDGPDKPRLQWALAYPEREQVHFKLAHDAVEAVIHRLEELPDGFSFKIEGELRSGEMNGMPFLATYSIETRSGSLMLGRSE